MLKVRSVTTSIHTALIEKQINIHRVNLWVECNKKCAVNSDMSSKVHSSNSKGVNRNNSNGWKISCKQRWVWLTLVAFDTFMYLGTYTMQKIIQNFIERKIVTFKVYREFSL